MAERRLRIIGGELRGRKIIFPENEKIRPTPDRIRETLFNWLAPFIHGARCLDLFAGSGLLGIEALSRGATHVTFIDKDPSITAYLQKTLQALNLDNVEIHESDVIQAPPPLSPPFDIIFCDPPFGLIEFADLFARLLKLNILQKDTLIYFESSTPLDKKMIAADLQLIKEKRAGQVYYHLLKIVV